MVTKSSFCHNLTVASKQKTYLTQVVKEYALMKEMSCRPLNRESFGHNLNSSLNGNGSLVSSRVRFFESISDILAFRDLPWEKLQATGSFPKCPSDYLPW